MSKRFLSAVLIVWTLLQGISVPVRGQQADGQPVEEKLTREEELEALRIAEQFVRSFEEQEDPLSMIDKLYVKDFDARLRNEVNSFIYLVKVEPEVVAKASDKELRRLYAASLNFIYASAFLYGLDSYNAKLNGEEAANNDPPLNKLLPPEVILILKSDPIMAELIAEDEEEERERAYGQATEPAQGAEGNTEEEERANGPEIRSLERLRGFVSTLEKATVLIREHLRTVRGPHTWKELMNAIGMAEGRSDRPDGCKGICPRVNTLRDKFFGSPAGTRLVCLNVLPFHIDLVKVDGRLRILTVYLMND